MARSQVGASWAGASYTARKITFAARTITAGSLVVVFWRYEGQASPVCSSVTDGTNSFTFQEYSGNPTVGIAYKYNHPGGTSLAIEVNFSADVAFQDNDEAIEFDGSDSSDPIDGSMQTATGTNPSVSYTASADGLAFANTGFFSTSSITPTSPATTIDNDTYASFYMRSHSSGSNSIGGTGGSGTTNTIVAVFKDPAGGGSPALDDSGVSPGTMESQSSPSVISIW